MSGTVKNSHRSQSAFTIIEILLVVAVIAILGMVAMVGYQQYTARSRAADILSKYDAIRAGVGSELAQASGGSCDELAKRLGTTNLEDEYARLAYSFESMQGGGFRPVLNVCAKADTNGTMGVKVARGAHDTMEKVGRVEKGAVLTDTVVSFALPLTDSGKSVCTGAPASPLTICGAPGATTPSAQAGPASIPASGPAQTSGPGPADTGPQGQPSAQASGQGASDAGSQGHSQTTGPQGHPQTTGPQGHPQNTGQHPQSKGRGH